MPKLGSDLTLEPSLDEEDYLPSDCEGKTDDFDYDESKGIRESQAEYELRFHVLKAVLDKDKF